MTQSLATPRRRRSDSRRSDSRRSDSRRPVSRPRSGTYWFYLLPGLVGFVLVIGIPWGMNVFVSFTQWRGTGSPSWIGLENYRDLWHDDVFWQSFRNNVAMVFAMAIVPTLLGLVIAAVLADYVQEKLGRRTAVRSGPSTTCRRCCRSRWPASCGAGSSIRTGALNAVLRDVGLKRFTQDWLGNPHTALPSVMLVMVWVQLGYPVVMFMAGLQRVDPELHEAAELDGASWWQRLRHISVPSIRPEIFVVLLTRTIAALKVFGPIYVLTRGGPDNATKVPSYFAYQNFFKKARVGYGAAISTVMTLIILVLTAAFIRAQNRATRDEA